MKKTTWWFEVTDVDCEFCGEEFLVEVDTDSEADARQRAEQYFPNVKLTCYGKLSDFEAEAMGIDTYQR